MARSGQGGEFHPRFRPLLSIAFPAGVITALQVMPASLRFAVFGAGFWTPFQLAGWREVGGVEPVAIYNRTPARAEAMARQFGIPAVYDDAEHLMREVRPDFVDNITEVGGHKPLSLLCAKYRVACICQKPLAASYRDAAA